MLAHMINESVMCSLYRIARSITAVYGMGFERETGESDSTTDNAAYFYGVATRFEAKVFYKHNLACKNKTGSFLLV